MGFVLIGMAMARSGIHDTRVLARFGLAAFVLASAPCVLLAGSVAPAFAASDSAESSIWEPEGEALVDWCLDVAQEELYPCTRVSTRSRRTTSAALMAACALWRAVRRGAARERGGRTVRSARDRGRT